MKKIKNAGFTLIELSIVLVIIGLLVGGVLVGRDLILAAEIRSTVSQYEKFQTAANTFRLKYGYLPGDIPQTVSSSYGLFTYTHSNPLYGDGDGLLGPNGSGGVCGQERLSFWRHLSDTNLIDGQYGSQGGNAIDPTTGYVTTIGSPIALSLPPAKLDRNMFWNVDVASVITTSNYVNPPYFTNYYMLLSATSTGMTTFGAGCSTQTGVKGNITAQMLYNIDSKIDDGKPSTGIMQAIRSLNWSSTASNTACMIGAAATDSASVYNLVAGNIALCPSATLKLN